jgi:hypothetical protein
VGLAQRVIEKQGIVTVSLTNMPFITEKIRVPRAVAVEFPFGMIWGLPGDEETHKMILAAVLDAVETIDKPGTIIELPYTWPEEERKKKNWFSKEPTPWMASEEGMNQIVEFLQHGNPME